MKIELWSFADTKEPWFLEFSGLYIKKINHLFSFEIFHLSSSSRGREQAAHLKDEQSQFLLKKIDKAWGLCLLDETGKSLSSEQWAQQISQWPMTGKTKWIFLIGGAYGVSEDLKKRAQFRWSLAPFTLNHLVAEAVVLEQIYRAGTLIKGLPYHNR